VPLLHFEIRRGGQKILAQRDSWPTNKRIDTPLNKLAAQVRRRAATLDEYGKWVKLYEEIFGKGQ